jgi:hypothetical protein
MADVNKSVEITLKANIKQLQKNLEQIPGMTKKEAQAMVRALSSEFNKAQKAAKAAASANKAAAKETSTAYKTAGNDIKASFKEASNAATDAAKEIKVSFEDAAEETSALEGGVETVATAFGAATLAVDKMIPNMDEGTKKVLELADGLATAAEQAIKGGPMTAALTAATVALTFAVDKAQESHRKHAAAVQKVAEATENAKNKNKELADSFKDIENRTRAIDEQFGAMAERVNEATLDLAVARGEMTEREAESMRIEMEAARMREEGQKIFKDRNQLQKEFRDLKMQEAQATQDQASALFEAMKGMHQGSAEQKRAQTEYNRLQKEARQMFDALIGGSRKFTEELEGYVAIQENSFAIAENAATQYEKQQKELLKIKDAEEARERSLQRQAEIQQHLNMILTERDQTDDRIRSRQIARLDGEERINAEAQRELAIIKEKEDAIIKEAELAIQTAKTQEERLQAQELEKDAVRTIAQLEAERREVETDRVERVAQLNQQYLEQEQKIKESIKSIDNENLFITEKLAAAGQIELDALDARLDKLNEEKQSMEDKEQINATIAALEELRARKLGQIQKEITEAQIKNIKDVTALTLGSLSSITADGLKLAQNVAGKNKELINTLFRANQAASVANIAMKTAEAIAAAPAQYGPFAPAAIAAIVAQAAVQTGVVLSQQPPLHMGGVVAPLAPDEQSRTVLTGEAVLDRATVRRLGGEGGIQRLQEGGTMAPDVIVMNPFKHLDRYNRSAIRNRNSAFSRLQPTQRQKY